MISIQEARDMTIGGKVKQLCVVTEGLIKEAAEDGRYFTYDIIPDEYLEGVKRMMPGYTFSASISAFQYKIDWSKEQPKESDASIFVNKIFAEILEAQKVLVTLKITVPKKFGAVVRSALTSSKYDFVWDSETNDCCYYIITWPERPKYTYNRCDNCGHKIYRKLNA